MKEEVKKRLYYLDIIKLCALVLVFVCHYTRSLESRGVGFVCKVLPDSIFHLYIGSFGVTLFFIASGASLMYVYQEKLNVKNYFKKRFLGIYPCLLYTSGQPESGFEYYRICNRRFFGSLYDN